VPELRHRTEVLTADEAARPDEEVPGGPGRVRPGHLRGPAHPSLLPPGG